MFVFAQAERLRKQADAERLEAVDNLAQATNQNSALTQAKKKLEGTIATLQEEAEDLENEAKNADDRAKKAAIEVRYTPSRFSCVTCLAGMAKSDSFEYILMPY